MEARASYKQHSIISSVLFILRTLYDISFMWLLSLCIPVCFMCCLGVCGHVNNNVGVHFSVFANVNTDTHSSKPHLPWFPVVMKLAGFSGVNFYSRSPQQLVIYWFMFHVVLYHLISVHNGIQREEAFQMKPLQDSKKCSYLQFNALEIHN